MNEGLKYIKLCSSKDVLRDMIEHKCVYYCPNLVKYFAV